MVGIYMDWEHNGCAQLKQQISSQIDDDFKSLILQF